MSPGAAAFCECGNAPGAVVCELFVLASDKPAKVAFSLGVFGGRGGRFGLPRDGWGIALRMAFPLGQVMSFKRGRRVG